MVQLIDILRLPQFVGLTDVQAKALGDTLVDGVPDQQVYHWDGVLEALALGYPNNGLTQIQIATAVDILSTMPVGFKTLDAMFSTGCIISSSIFIGTVKAMEVAEPPSAVQILEAILAIGATPQITTWASLGLTIVPILSDITTTMQMIAVKNWVDHVINDIIPPLLTSNANITTIKAAIAGV